MLSFARTVSNLVSILESESGCVINWFRDNSIIVNLDKFQSILLDKTRMLESLAGCRTMFPFPVFCKIDALERNAY